LQAIGLGFESPYLQTPEACGLGRACKGAEKRESKAVRRHRRRFEAAVVAAGECVVFDRF
jgi:hypothetical protein